MPDSYGQASGPDRIPESTPPREVRNGPWRVALKLSADGCYPKHTAYSWSVDGKHIEPERVGPCLFYSNAFPTQKTYDVEVQATVGGQKIEGHESIEIKDWLIVSIGDSIASGEGAPEPGGSPNAKWQNPRCHRSAYAAPAVAAQELAEQNPTVSVTFVHIACSGATIVSGLIGEYPGLTGSGSERALPPQVDEVNALGRTPDAVVVSIGANDVGFGEVVVGCGRRLHRNSCFRKHLFQKVSLGERVAKALDLLPLEYAKLRKRLRVPPAKVYLTEYLDPTGDVTGETCKRILRTRFDQFGWFGLTRSDLEDARTQLLLPLNAKVELAVDEHRWTEITGIASAFSGHGYCAKKQRWITTAGESFFHQGGEGLKARTAGTLHPNREGYKAIAAFIRAALEKPLKGSCAVPVRPFAREIAYPSITVSDSSVPCPSPMAVVLPLIPPAMLGGLDASLSILIGLAGAAVVLLALSVVLPNGRVREATPAVLMTVVGAALIDLSVNLQEHTAQAVVLSVAGAFALIGGPALLWSIRNSKHEKLIHRVKEKVSGDEDGPSE